MRAAQSGASVLGGYMQQYSLLLLHIFLGQGYAWYTTQASVLKREDTILTLVQCLLLCIPHIPSSRMCFS